MLTLQQCEDVVAIRSGRRLVANDMGTGKTRIALAAAKLPVLIICPAIVKSHWAAEAAVLGLTAQVLTGMGPWSIRSHVVIVNYEIVHSSLTGFKTVILDEAHLLGNMETQRYRKVDTICSDNVIALTGTPILNRAADLFPILRLLDRDTYKSFADFGMVALGWWERLTTGMTHRPRTLSELRAQLVSTILLRRESDRPMINRIDVTGEPTIWLNHWLVSNPGKKVIVFGHHHDVLIPMARRFQSQCKLINGKITGEDREHALRCWRLNPAIRIMFANIRAAGMGWDGSAADTVVFLELPWTAAAFDQAAARINRITQKSSTLTCYVFPNARRQAIINRKRSIFQSLFGSNSYTVE